MSKKNRPVVNSQMSNKPTYEELEQRVQALESELLKGKQTEKLKEIQQQLIAKLKGKRGLKESLETILKAILQLEAFDSGGVYLVDDKTKGMSFVAHSGLPQWFINEVAYYEPDDLRIKLIMEGKPLYMATHQFPPSIARRLESADIISMAIIPLFFRERVIGCLNLASHTGEVITPDNLSLVEEIASSHLGLFISQVIVEETLQENIDKFEMVFHHNASLMVLSTLEDGRFIDVNDKFMRVLGYERHEVIGKTAGDLKVIENISQKEPVKQALREKGYVRNVELKIRTKSGELIEGLFSGDVVELRGKSCWLTIFHDITDLKRAKEEQRQLKSQLRQAQKMESIGTLAGGIAHDFNNILGIILGNIELATKKIPEENSAHRNLNEVVIAGLRAKEMVSQILSFSRQTEEERKPVQLRPVVEEAIKLVRSVIPATIEIRTDFSISEDATILGNSTQINQIVMNLSANAVHAMGEKGGGLEFYLRNMEVDEEGAALDYNLKGGQYLALIVNDTGYGMGPEIIERMFDPYFTTKEVGEGSGMGLSVVHGILKNHEATVHVESEPGEGTCFCIRFPEIKTQVKPAKDHITPLPKGSERILFVEDETTLAALGQRMLQHLEYDVTVKTSSVEALEAFRTEPDQYDLLVTDMVMPEKTGKELAQDIMKIRPDFPVILCTGYTEMITKEDISQTGIKAFMVKPFAMRDIAETIRQVLDQEKT